MVPRSLSLVPLLFAAPALAQNSDLSTLIRAATAARHNLAQARLRQAAAAQTPPPAPAAPAKTAALSCRAVSGDPYAAIDGTLDLNALTLTSARAGSSPLLDTLKGAALIDGRCGKTALPLADSDNFEVTPANVWGQEILQLPKAALAASLTDAFRANLHTCAFDGDWSTFDDVPLACSLTAR
jgi:hypothetical protein